MRFAHLAHGESLIDTFANKPITFALNESLPKEKTAILGVSEVSLYRRFLKYFKAEDYDATIPDCPLSFTQTIPIVYTNLKMLTPNQEVPVLHIEISLSRALLSPTQLSSSVFMNIHLFDLKPVLEEWTLREASEKDPNSSKLKR
jgi:hypothetical protein